jgi:hypothetical protein
MERLILIGLILLLSMTVVLAAVSSTIKFSGDDISSGDLPVKQKSGYYVWGALNRLKPVQVTVTNNIPVETYWASGYIKFNRIAVGEQTPVSIFNTILSHESDPNDPLGDYIIQYPNGNPINQQFYVVRKDANTYEIVCNKVPINTRAVMPVNYPPCPPLLCPPLVEENIIWVFTATMTV